MQKKLLIPFIALLLCSVLVQAQRKKPKEKYEERKDSTLIKGIDKTGNEADTSVDKVVEGIGTRFNRQLDGILPNRKITTLVITGNSDISELKSLTDRIKKYKPVKSTEKSFSGECQKIKVCHTCSSEILVDWLVENISDEYEFSTFEHGELHLKRKNGHAKVLTGKEGG